MVKRPLRFGSALHSGLTILVVVASACHKPIPPEEPTAAVISQQEDLQYLWNGTLSVLRKFEFVPDRQDRAAGVIATLPLTSMQWHEPWRQDVADQYFLLESSLHTIQRVVTVKFHAEPEPNVEVRVDVYRVSQPETQITSASSVLHGFAGLLPTEEGQMGPGVRAERVPLGRDAALEERLLGRILEFTVHPVADTVDTPAAEASSPA